MNEDWKTCDIAISALVGVRDFLTYGAEHLKPLLTEENTIQGWINVCCDILEAMENE